MKKILLTTLILGLSTSMASAFGLGMMKEKIKNMAPEQRQVLKDMSPEQRQALMKMSKEERKAFMQSKIFKKIDLDGDEKISIEEFLTHRKDIAEKRMNKNKLKKMNKEPTEIFAKMDLNSDGFISQEEMTAHREMRKEKRMERRENRKQMNN